MTTECIPAGVCISGRCQVKFLLSRHMCMHRVIICISNTLKKLMIRAQGLVF